jgi:hypothetical protein
VVVYQVFQAFHLPIHGKKETIVAPLCLALSGFFNHANLIAAGNLPLNRNLSTANDEAASATINNMGNFHDADQFLWMRRYQVRCNGANEYTTGAASITALARELSSHRISLTHKIN